MLAEVYRSLETPPQLYVIVWCQNIPAGRGVLERIGNQSERPHRRIHREFLHTPARRRDAFHTFAITQDSIEGLPKHFLSGRSGHEVVTTSNSLL